MITVAEAALKSGISKRQMYERIKLNGKYKTGHINGKLVVDEEIVRLKNPADNVFLMVSPERAKMISLNIKDARWALGLTSAEFAKRIGVSRDVIYRVENTIRMSVRTRDKIRRFLKDASKQG